MIRKIDAQGMDFVFLFCRQGLRDVNENEKTMLVWTMLNFRCCFSIQGKCQMAGSRHLGPRGELRDAKGLESIFFIITSRWIKLA